jgi:glyoxylate reductase
MAQQDTATFGAVARPRLVARDRFPGASFDRLADAYDVEIAGGAVLPRVPETTRPTAIFTYRENVDEGVLRALPQLRAVANYGVGIDRLDAEAMRRHDVALISPVGANAEAVADHTLGLILALQRRIVEGDRHVREGGFDELMSGDVHGTTIGIVGFGAIGRAVARRAKAFNMTILHHTRTPAPREVERDLGSTPTPLDELLQLSDVVSLHVPLTPATRGMIGARELALMRRSAILVNEARGAVCDEDALVEALVHGRIAGAALDVFASEPSVPEALKRLPNVVLSPHTADATWGTRESMTAACVERLLAVAPRLRA